MLNMNVTVTSWGAVIDTVQVLPTADAQAPPQLGTSPGGELAVRMTLVPLGNVAVHADVAQSMPAGSLVTLPIVALVPELARFTRSANAGRKMALTVCAAVIATVQVGALVD